MEQSHLVNKINELKAQWLDLLFVMDQAKQKIEITKKALFEEQKKLKELQNEVSASTDKPE